MIEILYPDGRAVEQEDSITFEEIQTLVNGYVEVVSIHEHGIPTQCCCNEDGLSLGLPRNDLAMERFRDKIMMSPAVGVWVILTGRDLLR